jgi:hypothetical protein
VERAIMEMRNKKATKNYVPGDILELLGENGFRLIRQLSTTYMKLHNSSRISLKLQSLPYSRSKKLQKAATIAQSATLHTHQMLWQGYLQEALKRKLKNIFKKTSFDLEEKKEL